MRTNRDSDLPPIDNFLLVLAITCGIPGALVFVWILLRASWLSARLARSAESGTRNATINRIVAAIIPALILIRYSADLLDLFGRADRMAVDRMDQRRSVAWREANERETLLLIT